MSIPSARARARVPAAALSLILAAGCVTDAADQAASSAPAEGDAFKAYWYSGQAEINRYRLEQFRYGQNHTGDAVLIFVTEDFLPGKQVKYEHGQPGETPVSVLKLNFERKFVTGVYPYSMMTSVFTPIQGGDVRTLKVTSSSQEWCGQTFSQLNLRGGRYEARVHSYFQDEGDRAYRLAPVLLEDEIWNRIRLDPEALPEGRIDVIAGLQYARMFHEDTRVHKAEARWSVGQDPEAGPLRVYTVRYLEIPRQLTIRFEEAFPHGIVEWEASHGAGEPGDEAMITRAVRTHTARLDYWNKTSVEDRVYRRQLGLGLGSPRADED